MDRQTRKELNRNPRLRLTNALPAGETVLGVTSIHSGEGLNTPPRRLRPIVYRGHHNRCGPIVHFVELLDRLFHWKIGESTTGDPSKRDWYKRKKMALFGDWDSLAGTLTRSLFPRSRVTIETLMAVTERHLYVFWGEYFLPRRGEPLQPVLGWSTSRENLHWVRHRKDRSKGTYELGFTDGSWARVSFFDSRADLSAMFPYPLHYKDPVP